MTDEVKDDETLDAQEEQGLPIPAISAGSEDESSAQPSFDVEALAKRLLERLDPVIESKVDARYKSGKDVRFSKVDEIYEWVKASGGDPEKVRAALTESTLVRRIEDLETRLGSGGASGTAPSGSTLEQVATEILSQAGIELNDPLVAEWSGKSFPSERAALKSLGDSIAKKIRQSDVSPAAAATAGKQSASVKGETYESLAGELTDLRGKFDSESQKKRKAIQEKMALLESEMTFVEARYDAFGRV